MFFIWLLQVDIETFLPNSLPHKKDNSYVEKFLLFLIIRITILRILFWIGFHRPFIS